MGEHHRRVWVRVALLVLACGLCLFAAPRVRGAEEPAAVPVVPAAPAAESPKPTVIPVGEIAGQADSVDARLREIRTALSVTELEERIEASLPETEAEIVSRTGELEALLRESYQQGELSALRAGWVALGEGLVDQGGKLAARASQLDAWLAEMAEQRELWKRTRAEARRASAPATTLGRVGATLEELASAGRALESSRNSLLTLESRVNEQRSSVQAALERIEAATRALRAALFVRQQAPLWRVPIVEGLRRDLDRLGPSLNKAGASIATYARRHTDRLLVHVLLIAALLWAVRRARSVMQRRAPPPAASAEGLEEGATSWDALAHPWAAALLVGLSLSRALHPEAPFGFRVAVGLLVLPPWLYLLRGLLPAALRGALGGVAVLMIVSFVYELFSGLELLARLILMVEFALGLVWLLWLRRPERIRHFPSLLRHVTWLRILDAWLRICFGAFLFGFFAALFGYQALGPLVSHLIIWGSFLAALFLAAVRILEGLVEAFVEAGSLDRLRMVRTDRVLILGATRRVLRLLGTLTWIHILLRNAGLWDPVRDAGVRVLSAELGYGPAALSLGGVIAFGLTLWISWLLARFVSFFLDHEMFPRIRMAPGIPFALTTFTRYAILVIGFITAVAMLGFALDRVVLLVSALGVGIGFGLQNVVNSFVSGVILLFERPIRIGDRVQVQDLLGVVTHIGIRASHVRTFDGSEVVVPNGDFISSQLVNWTLSDQKRRIIVPIGVAYGTDPERVLEILEGVARSHPEVLADPPPEMLFRGFGDSSLNFELRAWTESARGWLPIHSDLAVGINRALAEAGITIPFPQRDLHVRNVPELREAVTEAVQTARGDKGRSEE